MWIIVPEWWWVRCWLWGGCGPALGWGPLLLGVTYLVATAWGGLWLGVGAMVLSAVGTGFAILSGLIVFNYRTICGSRFWVCLCSDCVVVVTGV